MVPTPPSPQPPSVGVRLRATLALSVVVAIGLIAAWFVPRPGLASGAPSDESGGRPVVGQQAPGFSTTALDGTAWSLASLRGKAVWLSFGATWCTDCRTEATDLRDASSAAKASGIETVLVFTRDDAAAVKSYSATIGFKSHLIPDPESQVAAQYRIVGVPTHYFIGSDGLIKQVVVGVLTREQMDADLADLQRPG
jgi:cytochrome c biogenesis protein CcmG/thiol:disulfide interchange protein DsbE